MADIRRIKLWKPDSGTDMPQARKGAFLEDISEPELHVFSPDKANNTGIAAVICPGGGYGGLALGPEGHSCAAYLAEIGITGMVLQYRLPKGDRAVPLTDARQAMAYARSNAKFLGFKPGKLGVIGFSAGGHLAGMTSTAWEDAPVSTRPDFSVLYYPVISLEEAPKGMTAGNLLGGGPSPSDLAAFSSNVLVTASTPPALLFHCTDDPLVTPKQSILYYEALRKHGIATSMHIFPEGGHAWGFRKANMEGKRFRYGEPMRALLRDWIFRIAG